MQVVDGTRITFALIERILAESADSLYSLSGRTLQRRTPWFAGPDRCAASDAAWSEAVAREAVIRRLIALERPGRSDFLRACHEARRQANAPLRADQSLSGAPGHELAARPPGRDAAGQPAAVRRGGGDYRRSAPGFVQVAPEAERQPPAQGNPQGLPQSRRPKSLLAGGAGADLCARSGGGRSRAGGPQGGARPRSAGPGTVLRRIPLCGRPDRPDAGRRHCRRSPELGSRCSGRG